MVLMIESEMLVAVMLRCVIGDLFTDGFIGVLCKLNLIYLVAIVCVVKI
jgi:hypothetical protein